VLLLAHERGRAMMSGQAEQNRAFLEAIRESPEDDAPRLIYADWLDDHGQAERAAFIRVQCELARGPGEQRRKELEDRERALLVANREAWLGPLDKALSDSDCTFRRGFPEDLTIRPRALVERAEQLEARVPVGRVELSGGFGDPAMKALLACPHLGWVVGLRYEHPRLTEAGLVMVARSPNLPRLGELSVEFAQITTTGVQALATSVQRRALRRVHLDHSRWGGASYPATADALAAPGVLFRLRSLSLHGHHLGPAGTAVLAETENLAEVKELDLLLNNLCDEGAIALARSPHLRGLSSLVLQTNNLTSRSVRELTDSPLLEGIRRLNLAVNAVGDEGAETLAACPYLRQLEVLGLFHTQITDRGTEALAASPHLSKLTDLQLWGNQITERGSQALFESPHLRRLARISLSFEGSGGKANNNTRQRKLWKERLGKGAQV
jgi:uncharacterized protein (TIGR02996 family)